MASSGEGDDSGGRALFVHAESPVPRPSRSPLPFLGVNVNVVIILVGAVCRRAQADEVTRGLRAAAVRSVSAAWAASLSMCGVLSLARYWGGYFIYGRRIFWARGASSLPAGEGRPRGHVGGIGRKKSRVCGSVELSIHLPFRSCLLGFRSGEYSFHFLLLGLRLGLPRS